ARGQQPRRAPMSGTLSIAGSVALVAGANRGLGRAFARALVERGAATVYAGARDPRAVTDPDVIPIRLGITNPADIEPAARACADVTLRMTSAGISHGAPLLAAPSLVPAREELEVNYFGTLAMCRAFAPILAANGGGALVNMLSALSFLNLPLAGSYSSSK